MGEFNLVSMNLLVIILEFFIAIFSLIIFVSLGETKGP